MWSAILVIALPFIIKHAQAITCNVTSANGSSWATSSFDVSSRNAFTSCTQYFVNSRAANGSLIKFWALGGYAARYSWDGAPQDATDEACMTDLRARLSDATYRLAPQAAGRAVFSVRHPACCSDSELCNIGGDPVNAATRRRLHAMVLLLGLATWALLLKLL